VILLAIPSDHHDGLECIVPENSFSIRHHGLLSVFTSSLLVDLWLSHSVWIESQGAAIEMKHPINLGVVDLNSFAFV